MKVYDILSNSNIALTGLTVFYAYEPNGCWMLLWRLANDPSLGKTLRKVRIVVLLGQNIPKDILESLNKSRSRFRKVTNNATADNHANNLEPCLDSGVDPADDFARVVVVPSSPNLEPSAQWGESPQP